MFSFFFFFLLHKAAVTLCNDHSTDGHGRLLVPPRRYATGLRTTATATDIDMRPHIPSSRTASGNDKTHSPAPLNPYRIIRIFALCIDHGTTMMTPTSPPKRLPFVPLQLITTTPHVSGPPTRGVNSYTNGNVSQRAIAWLKNVQESNNAGARRRDQPSRGR